MMPTTVGNIWAQATWAAFANVNFSHDFVIVFSQPRKIHAQASLSSFAVLRGSHSHSGGASEVPWLASGGIGIVEHTESSGAPVSHSGESAIAASNATSVTFHMNRFFSKCAGSIQVNMTINYF
jgi:hypothetical protein